MRQRVPRWGLGGLLLAATLAPGAAQVPGPGVADEGLYLTDPSTGREVRVDRDGELLHLAFFATWCPDCLAELDRMADLADRWTERGYRLVLVALPERQTPERLSRFVENRRPPGRVLLDRDGKLGERLRVRDVPTHILLDPGAREIGRFLDAAAAGAAVEQRLGRSDD